MAALSMVLWAAAIILIVKYGLLRGIDHLASALKLSPKARGQVTGYATSVPELVCLIAAGLAGVWQAGLWNIASSNIINCVLMLLAVLYHRQFRELLNRRFLDEVGFAALAVTVPIVLMMSGMDRLWYLIPILLAFFVAYRAIDKLVNPPEVVEPSSDEAAGSLRVGIALGLTSLAGIAVAGIFLGNATAAVVEELGIHPAVAGWILGLVTSVPELVSFFTIYATARRRKLHEGLDDTQEALDNLTGSNMANVGIVYPMGLLAFLLGSLLQGGG